MAERKVRDGRALLGIPVSALAALPVCPACYPAYAGVLSALGLGALANTTAQTVLTALLLSLALIALETDTKATAGDVRQLAEKRLLDIEERIRALQRMRRALRRVTEECHGGGPTSKCSILRTLSKEET